MELVGQHQQIVHGLVILGTIQKMVYPVYQTQSRYNVHNHEPQVMQVIQ